MLLLPHLCTDMCTTAYNPPPEMSIVLHSSVNWAPRTEKQLAGGRMDWLILTSMYNERYCCVAAINCIALVCNISFAMHSALHLYQFQYSMQHIALPLTPMLLHCIVLFCIALLLHCIVWDGRRWQEWIVGRSYCHRPKCIVANSQLPYIRMPDS